MSLDRINTTKFLSDKDQSERSARAQLSFIFMHEADLIKGKNGEKLLRDAKDMAECFTLSDKQKSYIDSIYEKVMKALGFESYTSTFRPRKKNLRF